MPRPQPTFDLPDIKPQTPVAALDRSRFEADLEFDVDVVAQCVGMSRTFIRKIVGRRDRTTLDQRGPGAGGEPRPRLCTRCSGGS